MNIQDWFPLKTGLSSLEVKRTLKSLLQHYSSKASILWCTTFFMVQLSHPYMTTGKTKALTRCTFVGNVMCLLFNMVSSFIMAFLPKSKCLLISWLQSPFAVILEPKKLNFHCFHCFPISHEVMGLDVMILDFGILSFKPVFHSLFSPSSRGCLIPLHFLP